MIQFTRFVVYYAVHFLYWVRIILFAPLYLSIQDFSSFEKRYFAYVEFQFACHKSNLDKKFSCLHNSSLFASHVSALVQNSLANLSSHPLIDSQCNVLSLDVIFSCVSKPSIHNLVAPIEYSFKNSKISSDQLISVSFLLSNVISASNYSQKSKFFPFSEMYSLGT